MPKKPPPQQKTREQRILESVEILANIKSVGADKDPGMTGVKEKLDEWIATGEQWQGRVDFPRYGRYADIILPSRADRKPTCILRATPELIQQEKQRKKDEQNHVNG